MKTKFDLTQLKDNSDRTTCTVSVFYLYFRLIWLLIVFVVSGAFVYLMVRRVLKYLDHDKNVNIEIVYHSEIDFPSFTICNQNFIRYFWAALHEKVPNVLRRCHTKRRMDGLLFRILLKIYGFFFFF